jgi:hypothetical protein
VENGGNSRENGENGEMEKFIVILEKVLVTIHSDQTDA